MTFNNVHTLMTNNIGGTIELLLHTHISTLYLDIQLTEHDNTHIKCTLSMDNVNHHDNVFGCVGVYLFITITCTGGACHECAQAVDVNSLPFCVIGNHLFHSDCLKYNYHEQRVLLSTTLRKS
jgi:hypothetical protein